MCITRVEDVGGGYKNKIEIIRVVSARNIFIEKYSAH